MLNLDDPHPRLTVKQYHTLIQHGVLTADDPVELLEGLLVVKDRKSPAHACSTQLLYREIQSRLPPNWHAASHQPITLLDSEPEPDGAVVRGEIEDFSQKHPGMDDVALVVEVSDTSLERDRGIKDRIYARAGVSVYWILNLIDRHLEVYTNPVASDGQPHYIQKDVFRPGETVDFQVGNERISLPVAAILPAA